MGVRSNCRPLTGGNIPIILKIILTGGVPALMLRSKGMVVALAWSLNTPNVAWSSRIQAPDPPLTRPEIPQDQPRDPVFQLNVGDLRQEEWQQFLERLGRENGGERFSMTPNLNVLDSHQTPPRPLTAGEVRRWQQRFDLQDEIDNYLVQREATRGDGREINPNYTRHLAQRIEESHELFSMTPEQARAYARLLIRGERAVPMPLQGLAFRALLPHNEFEETDFWNRFGHAPPAPVSIDPAAVLAQAIRDNRLNLERLGRSDEVDAATAQRIRASLGAALGLRADQFQILTDPRPASRGNAFIGGTLLLLGPESLHLVDSQGNHTTLPRNHVIMAGTFMDGPNERLVTLTDNPTDRDAAIAQQAYVGSRPVERGLFIYPRDRSSTIVRFTTGQRWFSLRHYNDGTVHPRSGVSPVDGREGDYSGPRVQFHRIVLPPP